jgi:hypothetical protein
MNKLGKIGLSALCGSLAAVSAAQAGDMSVAGAATATWSSNTGDVTGNPIGVASQLTFTGNGELDNGTAFQVQFAHKDKQAGFSTGELKIDTASLGSFIVSQATGGTGIDAYDDKMPTAWEETTGTSLGTGIDTVSGVGASTNIQYKTPKALGTTLAVAYAYVNDGATAADKAPAGSAASYKQEGYDVVLDMNPSFGLDALAGFNLFAGYSVSERLKSEAAVKKNPGDHEEGTIGGTFAYGPVTLGFQRSGEFTGSQTPAETEYYDNTMWGVSFNINDNLSISAGEFESIRQTVGSADAVKKVITTAESYQLSYTVGGASIKIAESKVDNASYASGSSNDKDATTVALSLAF